MPRILYLTPLAPLPTTDGGRQRTNLLYDALSRVGGVSTIVVNQTAHPITERERAAMAESFGLLDVVDVPRVGRQKPWRWLGSRGDFAAHLARGWGIDYGHDAAIRDRVAGIIDGYDVVVSRYLWAPAVAGVIGGGVPVVVDVDDRESERIDSSMPTGEALARWSGSKRWWWRRRVSQLAETERALLGRCDHFWLTKRQDLEGIESLGRHSLLPNIPFHTPDASSLACCSSAGQALLFVGSLGFGPNRSGMQRFIDSSWPAVRAACPEARLRIVGGSAPEAWSAIPGVDVLGKVPDLDDAYRQAAFSVVPLWEGAGTKIKVLESLQHRRTAVVTGWGMRGYEAHLREGESVLVADNEADFAQACVRLLQDRDLTGRLAACGEAQVDQHYTRAVFNGIVRETIQRVTEPVDA